MFVAVDDTDSMRGNCTTFLASEIIRAVTRNGWDLIGYPRLVRLNPAIPWKTRGNGSLVMEFGTGSGESRRVGYVSGADVLSFPASSGDPADAASLLSIISPVVDEFHDPVDSDPGLVVSTVRPDASFYRRGVSRVMVRSDAEAEIVRIGALKAEWGCGRGIIGCVCGMAWIPGDRTYELLTYRPASRWGTKRVFDRGSVADAEHDVPSSFNSWDDRNCKPAVVPATPCPVMYGFRADDPSDAVRGLEIIRTEDIERWVVFETNQGTDDHILPDPSPSEFIPNSSYAVDGTVSTVRRIRGGHTFVDLETDLGPVTAGIYAPAGEFRYVLDWLSPGDRVRVYGELRNEPRTLNIEKIQIVDLAVETVKAPNPSCPVCGRKMESAGKGSGYRCRVCKTRSEAVFQSVPRVLVPGWYEPPVAARRHLSKPLKRMGAEQPLGILRGRNV